MPKWVSRGWDRPVVVFRLDQKEEEEEEEEQEEEVEKMKEEAKGQRERKNIFVKEI